MVLGRADRVDATRAFCPNGEGRPISETESTRVFGLLGERAIQNVARNLVERLTSSIVQSLLLSSTGSTLVGLRDWPKMLSEFASTPIYSQLKV